MTNAPAPVVRRIEETDVAKIVRKDLKRVFPGVKFSVRTNKYAGGSSINVRWTDGPTEASVNELIGHYAGASFDGMTDLQSYHDTMVMGENGPEVVHYANHYIFASRELSDSGRDRLIEMIAADNPWREFGPGFPDEVIAHEADRYDTLHDRALNNRYIHRGWDLIHVYDAFTAL